MLGGNARAQGQYARFVNPPRTEPTPRTAAALAADHPVVVNGRSLFPTRVFDADQRKRVLIDGVNNAKIGKIVTKGLWAGFPIFTLSLEERATCPRSCAVWAECYGNALPVAVRFNPGPKLMEALDRELRVFARKYPRGFVVRLHALGDFVDRAYVERWSQWSDRIAALHVWGYTAHRPDSEIGQMISAMNQRAPDRWSVRFSVPIASPHAPMQAAVTWDKPTGERSTTDIACPAESGKTATCGTCGLCWSPAAAEKRIVFMGHGMHGGRKGQTAVTTPVPMRSDPVIEGARAFLGRLLTEQARLTRALAGVGALIVVYEKLVEAEAVKPADPPARPSAPPSNPWSPRAAAPPPSRAQSPEPPPEPPPAELPPEPPAPEPPPPEPPVEVAQPVITQSAEKDAARAAIVAKRVAFQQRMAEREERARVEKEKAEKARAATALATAPQPKTRLEALAMVAKAIDGEPTYGLGGPIAVEFEQVRRWAGERGLSFQSWEDLPVINRKRDALNQPTFKRSFPVRGRSL